MQDEKEKVALGSIAASAGLTVAKAVVGAMSGSLAILSEAAHSLIDLGATVMTYFAVRISGKPADEEHHYGHGKVESVTALAETALLFVLSGVVIWEAVQRLFGGHGHAVEATIVGVRRDRRCRSWSISSARACSTGWRTRPRARRSRPTRCISAPTCGRRSRCWSGLAASRSAIHGRTRRRPWSSRVFVCLAGWRLGRRTIETLTDTAPPAPPTRSAALAARVPRRGRGRAACGCGRSATSCSSRSWWR